MRKDYYLDFALLMVTIYAVLLTIAFAKVWQLYEPNAKIVIHDYGQVFENEIDWKIWRLEHEKDG